MIRVARSQWRPQCARALVSWDWARSRSWLWAQVQAIGARGQPELMANTGHCCLRCTPPRPGQAQVHSNECQHCHHENHIISTRCRGKSCQFRIDFRQYKLLIIIAWHFCSPSLSLSARSRGCLRVWLQSWDHVTRAGGCADQTSWLPTSNFNNVSHRLTNRFSAVAYRLQLYNINCNYQNMKIPQFLI